ncbi:amidohydrolase [Xenorhabdus sp. Vera]|uniref:M20 metallopeptidase family protein n=1 Tax=Xenorhabdus koppenhoeferi TaxID=351659 RepID=UPI001996AD06|nr:M20 family metallopeptidase [Xenorhabdus sp. Vera]MBD2811257.1 amidohydrolase [Xenorhabdus sp. Vera]
MNKNKYNVSEKLFALNEFSKKTRQYLHRIPELSGQEFKTSQYCRNLMRNFGYTIKTYEGYTGFIADLIIDPEKPLIALRADMDALAMSDMTNNEYTSIHPGRAHNCGHDVHMTAALTAANYLSQHQDEMDANVRFIFQMAEEDVYVPGADKMVELGCMEGVSEVYALHNNAMQETGRIDLGTGIMSSWGTAWTLDVYGVSAHASAPQNGLDAIREVGRILDYMDYIVAKKTSPFSPAVLSCGVIKGGTVSNAVADHVHAKGTIRAMDEETHRILKDSFQEILARSKDGGFKTAITYAGYPPVENHPYAHQRILEAANQFLPDENINPNSSPITASEDFSYMINATKDRIGAMFMLGSGNTEKGISNYLHSNPYFVDDDCMLVGAQIFINLVTH